MSTDKQDFSAYRSTWLPPGRLWFRCAWVTGLITTGLALLLRVSDVSNTSPVTVGGVLATFVAGGLVLGTVVWAVMLWARWWYWDRPQKP
jgi:hypothetical protein